MIRLFLVIVLAFAFEGCGASTLSPSDWGRAMPTTNLCHFAIIAMPSPRLDKPLEGNLAPTAYLARVAADHLKECVEVVDTSRSGADTNETWGGVGGWMSMERYLSRSRTWYVEEQSQINYSDLKKQGIDGVLEIGIGNYETFSQNLVLQVVVKLVDPATGTVLGKARSGAYEKIEPFTPEQFKLTFAQMGTTLMLDNLERIGLKAPGSPIRR